MKQTRTIVNLNEKHITALRAFNKTYIQEQEELGNTVTVPMILDSMYEKLVTAKPEFKVVTPIVGRPRKQTTLPL